MDKLIKIFKALSDENRLKILLILSKRKMCAKGIARHLDLSEPAVSQHIKILKDADIVEGKKIGYHVMYDMNKDAFALIKTLLKELEDDSEEIQSVSVVLPTECQCTCKSKVNKCCQIRER